MKKFKTIAFILFICTTLYLTYSSKMFMVKAVDQAGSVSLDSESYNVPVGGSKIAVAYYSSSDTISSFETVNSNIATVSEDSTHCYPPTDTNTQCKSLRINCLTIGDTTLNVSLDSNLSGSATIKCGSLEFPDNIGKGNNTFVLNTKGTFEVTLNNIPSSERANVEFNVSNPSILSITDVMRTLSDNSVYANTDNLKVGTTTVTATLNYDGNTYTATKDIQVIEPVKSISITADGYTGSPGAFINSPSSLQLHAIVTYNSGETEDVTDKCVWDSLNHSVANVKNGLVNFFKHSSDGTVKIYASYNYQSTTVYVSSNSKLITIEEVRCYPGENIDVLATAYGSDNGTALGIKSFTSTDETIATVESSPDMQPKCIECRNLRVTCKKQGTATINVLGTDNQTTGSAPVYVMNNGGHITDVPVYIIEYNSNGGTACSPASKSVQSETPIGELCIPSREGYDFAGWFTEKTGGKKITENSTVNGDLTIYAQWKQKVPNNPVTGIVTPVIGLMLITIASFIAYMVIKNKNMSLE